MELRSQNFLFLDCQTTGMRPPKAHLLELGWAIGSAAESGEAASFLVTLPEGEGLPKAVKAVTGITELDLTAARPAEEVREAFGEVYRRAGSPPLAVVHYARFEKPFLERLLGELPFRFLCSHELSGKLFPRAPSRNLRAILGFLGEDREVKRAGEHVSATVALWKILVEELEKRGIRTEAELLAWMETEPRAKRGGPVEYRLDRGKRLDLPDAPGVYRMLSRAGKVLYVGKATSLRSRVNSYFRGRKGKKKWAMLAQVWDVDVTVCPSPLEAALLEADEIKRLDPPYNVSLKGNGRGLVFYSRDLEWEGSAQGTDFPLGPFRAKGAIEQVRQLVRTVESLTFTGVFFEEVEAKTFAEGYALFREKYGLPNRARDYLALGLRFVRKLLEEKGEEGGEEEPEAEEDGGEEDEGLPLTPEDVALKLEGLVIQAALEYRRSKELTKLLGARVHWRENGEWRAIETRSGEDPRFPWLGLGLNEYDRLSVLRTELGRYEHRIER